MFWDFYLWKGEDAGADIVKGGVYPSEFENIQLGDTSQILITMFNCYNLPSFHQLTTYICYVWAPNLFRVVASTHSLYLIITGTPCLY